MNLTCWAKATASSSTLENKKMVKKGQLAYPCRRELLGSFDRFWLKSPHTSNFQLLPVCVLPIIRKSRNFLIKRICCYDPGMCYVGAEKHVE